MVLLDILIVIIVVGVLLWIINTFIPMDHKIKRIFNLVVVIALIIWLLKVFGLFSYLMNVHI
ncbi:MAG TPA: Thivi_2564 family membrane protein [Prolixibacteraceae bacterium]|nr:Thivi_2564 family membrane protein [Prolixibacteraceae bacterium]